MAKKNSNFIIFFRFFASFLIFFVVFVSLVLVKNKIVINDATKLVAFIMVSLVAAGLSFLFDSDWFNKKIQNFLTHFKK